MKNKNKRELEKHWAAEAAKKRKTVKAAKKTAGKQENLSQTAVPVVKQAPDPKEG